MDVVEMTVTMLRPVQAVLELAHSQHTEMTAVRGSWFFAITLP